MAWKQSVEKLARFGYACKGSVYIIIGLLAAATIVGHGEVADRQRAFRFIIEKPFGRLILIVIAAGFIGYATWRVISGFADSERHGGDFKGLAMRAGSVIRGLFYGSIAIELLRQVIEHRAARRGGDAQTKHWTARAMQQPFGRWAVAIAGAFVIGYAAAQFYRAIGGKLSKRIRTRSIPPWLLAVSRFGLGARAVILGIIGGSLIQAAWRYSAAQAEGTSGAMRTIAIQPFGTWLLTLAGLGFASYGVYAFVNARYRQISA
jgi:Domain of Unknown Function (DUF1206)